MKKPKKKIIINNSSTFLFDHISNNVSIDYFLNWIKQTMPKKAIDVTLSLDDEFCYDSGDHISSYIVLSWKEKINNEAYDKQMIKYEKWVKKQNDK